jgi:hypothetical protein
MIGSEDVKDHATFDEAVQALERRGIPHSGVMAGGTMPRFVYLRDAPITGKRLALSLWQIHNTNDHASIPR